MIRLLLVAPNPALRIGLREIFNSSPDLELVDEASGLQELDGLADEVDVLVIASLPGINWHDLPPGAAVLLLTEDEQDLHLLTGRFSRPWGALPINATENEILAAVHAVSEGLWVGAPALVRGILRPAAALEVAGPGTMLEAVTQREMDVLQLIGQGFPNKQIASALGISEHTVKFHLSSLYVKLGATNRTEAVRIGLQRGFIVL